MQLTSALLQVFEQLWWILPLLVAAGIAKTPRFKGYVGELLVRMSARFLLDTNEYRAIHDITLKTPDGTTQVDHVFVSRFGVFVVETKNYGGWIFGDENQAMWTQKRFKASYKFQNPLRQNYKHIKALESLTRLPSDAFHSVIVFVGGSKFKTEMPQNVTQTGGYIAYIKSKIIPILSTSEVDAAYQAISTGRLIPSLATNRTHVKNVQNRVDTDAPRSCPKCGAEMVKRTVKNGDKAGNQFWGCSEYPKCRTIQSIL
jgi:hypothetical protein